MKLNTPRSSPTIVTHEGAPARRIKPLEQLRRSVCSCLLWESEFYEDGESITKRIIELVKVCEPEDVARLAIEARESFNLRHVPLLLVRELARHPKLPDKLVATTLARVIQRADELSEFLAIYWKDKKQPLSKQVKRGLAWAFHKFDEYQLAKYNREGAVRLRDVLFLSHAKPLAPGGVIGKGKYPNSVHTDDEEAQLWKQLVDKELKTPDTWEVALSAGADKKEVFERLIREGNLGYLALLRNLRNMIEADCDPALIWDAVIKRKGAHRVLPFRFIAAATHAPQFEPALDAAMQMAMKELEKLPGRTLVLIDHSGSMNAKLSGKSELTRSDAAIGVGILARGVSDECRVFAFSDWCKEVPPRQGMALRDAVQKAGSMGGTHLGAAVLKMNVLPHDRLIVITDEQSHDAVPNPGKRGYMINVASAKNGVGYGPWVHINGWSEAVVRFILEYERPSGESGELPS